MEGIFLRVLNMSIAAGWLILAAALLRPILKKAPKWTVCLVWALVGVRLAVPGALESVLSLVPSGETVPPDIMYMGTPAIHSGISPLNSSLNPAIAESFSPQAAASANPLQVLTFVAAWLWICGVCAMLIYSAVSYFTLRRRVSTAVRLRDGIWQSESVGSPFVLGIFRPKIYLPFTLDEAQAAHVIAHEQAHIKRRDHWIKPIGFLLLALHWFNPLVWLAYVLLCRDIELACDEKVIKNMEKERRREYSAALLACSSPRRSIAACPLAFGEVGVKKRIKGVLSYKKPAFWVLAAALAACAVLAVCFLTDPPEEPDLSFLNYKNAVSIAAEQESLEALRCPAAGEDEGHVLSGTVSGPELAKFLDGASWKRCARPSNGLPSPNSVKFVLGGDYSISLYGEQRRAMVMYNGDSRCYKIGKEDYAAALTLLSSRPMPGTYVFTDCVYMNPLSSYMPMGSAGHDYIVGDDSFTIVSTDDGQVYESFTGIDWRWQVVTKDEWESLFAVDLFKPDIDPAVMEKTELSDGYALYNIDGTLCIAKMGEEHLWYMFAIAREGSQNLSLEKVLEINRQWGHCGITWDWLRPYANSDIGSGVYIYKFPIDGNWELSVAGPDAAKPGELIQGEIKLGYIPGGDWVDVTEGDVEAFIAEKQR